MGIINFSVILNNFYDKIKNFCQDKTLSANNNLYINNIITDIIGEIITLQSSAITQSIIGGYIYQTPSVPYDKYYANANSILNSYQTLSGFYKTSFNTGLPQFRTIPSLFFGDIDDNSPQYHYFKFNKFNNLIILDLNNNTNLFKDDDIDYKYRNFSIIQEDILNFFNAQDLNGSIANKNIVKIFFEYIINILSRLTFLDISFLYYERTFSGVMHADTECANIGKYFDLTSGNQKLSYFRDVDYKKHKQIYKAIAISPYTEKNNIWIHNVNDNSPIVTERADLKLPSKIRQLNSSWTSSRDNDKFFKKHIVFWNNIPKSFEIKTFNQDSIDGSNGVFSMNRRCDYNDMFSLKNLLDFNLIDNILQQTIISIDDINLIIDYIINIWFNNIQTVYYTITMCHYNCHGNSVSTTATMNDIKNPQIDVHFNFNTDHLSSSNSTSQPIIEITSNGFEETEKIINNKFNEVFKCNGNNISVNYKINYKYINTKQNISNTENIINDYDIYCDLIFTKKLDEKSVSYTANSFNITDMKKSEPDIPGDYSFNTELELNDINRKIVDIADNSKFANGIVFQNYISFYLQHKNKNLSAQLYYYDNNTMTKLCSYTIPINLPIDNMSTTINTINLSATTLKNKVDKNYQTYNMYKGVSFISSQISNNTDIIFNTNNDYYSASINKNELSINGLNKLSSATSISPLSLYMIFEPEQFKLKYNFMYVSNDNDYTNMKTIVDGILNNTVTLCTFDNSFISNNISGTILSNDIPLTCTLSASINSSNIIKYYNFIYKNDNNDDILCFDKISYYDTIFFRQPTTTNESAKANKRLLINTDLSTVYIGSTTYDNVYLSAEDEYKYFLSTLDVFDNEKNWILSSLNEDETKYDIQSVGTIKNITKTTNLVYVYRLNTLEIDKN